MDGEAGIADDQSFEWFEVRKKHRISSKLSTQKVHGRPSNKGHKFSDHNQELRNGRNLKISTMQIDATFKETTELNSSVNTSSLSEEAGKTSEHFENSIVELSAALSSDNIEEALTGTCREASKTSSQKDMTDTKSNDDFYNLKVTHVVTDEQNYVPNDLISVEMGSENPPEKSVGRNLTGDASRNNLDHGDVDQSESKERFRERLWCFLFENLNRAVDELYLLCELECDMGQMTEAILVLEEAIADIRELHCRVEHFEGTKRYAVQSSKDIPMTNLKTDHRRPHALSWEVRRMSTSPRRAEILSSSLEAFKKIQLERAGKQADHEVKDPMISSTIQNGNEISHGTNEKQHSDSRGSESCRRIEAVQGNSNKGKTSSEKMLVSVSGKCKKESLATILESEREALRKTDKLIESSHITSNTIQTNSLSVGIKEKENDKRNTAPWRKSMDAWKEKRNWQDILKSPLRNSSRASCSPAVGRKSADRADRARVLHDKLMSPEKKKKNALDTRRDAEERHARAMRIRGQLENERLQKLQRASEKLSRVSEWQIFRSVKLREGLNARQQRGESRHEAYLARVSRRAGDESSKVNEVRFITSLNEENKKLILRQKLHDSELRKAEKMQIIKIKQKEDTAREEAAMERRKLLETEKMMRLAEMQRKKEDAQLRKEEERKVFSAALEAKAVEQLRRKEIRAKAQQEEAELLAQKLAQKLSESEQRRKFYLEQIREKASMDFRDQSSPLLRRSVNREGSIRPTYAEDNQTLSVPIVDVSLSGSPYATQQPAMKRKIKRIRQRLMALKHEFVEPPFVSESLGVGYRALVGSARAKIGKWVQELQKLRQARKEGTSSFGLIVGDMIKYLEGKDIELQVSRQAGLLDFISSALPASHTSKPESCKITVYLLRLLRVVLSVPSNRGYFLALNLLPPIIPMLSASLDNYIKIAASSNKMAADNMDTITETLDCFLFTVASIMGLPTCDERELQMQDGLLELIVSYQAVHHFRDLFVLYDRPQVEGAPFPSSIMLSLNLLSVLTSRTCFISPIDWEAGMSKFALEKKKISPPCDEIVDKFVTNDTFGSKNTSSDEKSKMPLDQGDHKITIDGKTCKKKEAVSKQSASFLLAIVEETGLISLTSLLTAVLLQANSRLSSDQASYVLPSNFEEVAIGVLKVLNNLACLDISLLQKMLSRSDLKMEFFHLMSFLLSHCTSKWKSVHDQVGLLLMESLLLLGYFTLFHAGNQAVLRWGKTPTILHKVCDLPFVFFSDPELTPILAGTFVASCYGCEQNRGVIQQEISMGMLISLLKSCRQSLLDILPPDISTSNASPDAILSASEVKKSHGDGSSRPHRKGSLRNISVRGENAGTKVTKYRVQRDNRVETACDEWALKHNFPALEASYAFMLHRRFPACLLDKAEEFFSAEISELPA